MANGESKPGQATADRIREKSERERRNMARKLEDAYDKWEVPTQPRIMLASITRDSDRPPDSVIPGMSKVPRKWRPYVVGAVIALALTGTGTQIDLGILLRLLGVAP